MFCRKYTGIFILLVMCGVLVLVNIKSAEFLGGSFLWVLLVSYSAILANLHPQWSKEFHLVGIHFLLLMILNCVVSLENLQNIFSLWAPTIVLVILICVGISHFYFNVSIVRPTESKLQQKEVQIVWARLLILFRLLFLMGAFGYGITILAGYVGLVASYGYIFQPRIPISGLIYLGYALYLLVYLYYLLKIKDGVLFQLMKIEISDNVFRRASRWFLLASGFFFLVGVVFEYLRQNWILFVGNNLIFIAYGLSLWKLLGARARSSVIGQGPMNVESVVKINPLNFQYLMVNASIMLLLSVILLVVSI